MMQVQANKNNQHVFEKIEKLHIQFEKAIQEGWQIIGQNLIRTNREDFDKPKTGRKYRSLPRRSSAIGEPPAKQFGNLSRSLYARVNGLNMVYGADIRYATLLEGTRPYLSKAVKDNAGNNISVFIELFGQYIS